MAADPPKNLARLVAERESECETVRTQYTYRQSVVLEEYGGGRYQEAREILFKPGGERTDRFTQKPSDTLRKMKLTEEDHRDLRDVQPLLLTKDRLWLYEVRPRGEEDCDGAPCWVLAIRPRQILDGQRLFDGLIWIDQSDFSIVRATGRAVPQIVRIKSENLFPEFTTTRERIGDCRFPVRTEADDTLPFRTGPVRIKLRIVYSDYKKFSVDSAVTFDTPR